MSAFLGFLRSFGLLVARIGVGGIMIAHGYVRWQIQGIEKQTAYLTQFGTPYPEVAAWGSTIFEIVGGVFLVVGALTPLIGLGLLIQQVLTISYTNYSKSWNLMTLDGAAYNGGFEYNVALGVLGLLFLVMGGGAAAIDRLFKRSKTDDDVDDTSDLRTSATV